ncbi:MAG TPA: SusC/RagA family TonB-linked outer membrane protein [Chitinophaga sp.]|uniref:SusC/RagA family TonB-linked outer membrane protein n=1 Tax=Chitinophaga sp. TaxID=1869181 RepID=UPI002F954233
MKLITLLLLAGLMQVSASTYAQKITLSAKNEELINVFDQISDQSGYDFMVTSTILKKAAKVNIQVKDAALKDVLELIFKGQPLEFTIRNKTVLVKQKEQTHTQSADPANGVTAASNIDVKGKVTGEDGTPLPGATIRIKGSPKQTFANENGDFYLPDVPENAVLQVSFVGYKTIAINAAAEMGSVALNVQTGELKEITVSTGYQTLSKERVTGSFSSISAGKLQQQRLSSIGSLLEGRIPGYNNGLIRGTTSMNGVTTPLYVVDGFPVENTRYTETGSLTEAVPGLNLEDIESITVLKDAAAASIYGARAANGVVVIVTRKGKKGKPQISASTTFTFSTPGVYTGNLTNSADIVDLEKEWAAANPNLKGPGAAAYASSLLDNMAYPSQGINALLRYYSGTLSEADLNTKLNQLAGGGYQYYDDVKKYAKRNPFYQQHNLSVGNATEKNSFYASVTYRHNNYEDKFAKDQMLGLNINNTFKVNKWLSLELSNYLQYSDARGQQNRPLSPGYAFQPYDRLVNADGSNFTSTAASRFSKNTMSLINDYHLYNMDITPLDEQAMSLSNTRGFSNRSYVKLNADITSWLSYKSTFQYEYANDQLDQLYDKNSYYVRSKVNSFAGSTGGGATVFNLPYGNINYTVNQRNVAYNFRQQLNIDKTFSDKHNLTAIVGTETRQTKLEYNTRYLYNYDPEVLTYTLIDARALSTVQGAILGGGSFSANDVATQREIVNRFISIYSNAGYAYDNKYLLTGSLRWDRSNLWGTNSKYQNKPLWSAGAGWNIYKESFFNVNWVNLLKVRASYGISGNIAKDAAPYMTANYYSNNTVGGLYGTIASRPNPLLSWEKTTTTNVGLDYAIFDNRLSGTIDYYHKQGNDLLANTMGVPTEGFGYATYSINNGAMLNQGIELSLSADVIRNKDLTWNATLQYARNKNKVTYVNVEAPVYFLQLDYPQAYPRIGNPYNAIYSYRWAGLSEKGLPQVYDEKGGKALNSPATLESIVYAGSTVPEYSGSFNSSVSYKNFVLSFLLTFEGGHKIRNTFLPMLGNAYNSALFGYVSTIGVVNKDIVNRWRNPGDENHTQVPRAVFAEDPDYNSQSYDIYKNADINVLNASNMRMRNISLAYSLPERISRKAGIEHVRLQFNAENLFMIAANKTAKYLLGGYYPPNYVMGAYLNF